MCTCNEPGQQKVPTLKKTTKFCPSGVITLWLTCNCLLIYLWGKNKRILNSVVLQWIRNFTSNWNNFLDFAHFSRKLVQPLCFALKLTLSSGHLLQHPVCPLRLRRGPAEQDPVGDHHAPHTSRCLLNHHPPLRPGGQLQGKFCAAVVTGL